MPGNQRFGLLVAVAMGQVQNAVADTRGH
jgi:hypothetical protein